MKMTSSQGQLQEEDCTVKRCIVRTADSEDFDKAVFVSFVLHQSSRTPVCGLMPMAKAASMYGKLYPKDEEPENFKAITGWRKQFGEHRGMHSLKTQGESLSADSSAAAPFQEQFQKIVEEENLARDQVFNWDKMRLNWRPSHIMPALISSVHLVLMFCAVHWYML